MRARVLKIEGELVTLGVYYQGEWLRLFARTQIPLTLLSWIEGEMLFSDDGQEVQFRIDSLGSTEQPPGASVREGLDLEA